jgi:hypothetical protein
VIKSSPSAGDDRSPRLTWSYRVAWTVCANTLIAVGLVCALASWGWLGPASAILTVAFFVVVIAMVVLPGTGLGALPKMLWRGLYAGTVLTAATGLTVVFGALGFFLVLLLSAIAPGLGAGLRLCWGLLTAKRDVKTLDEETGLASPVASAPVVWEPAVSELRPRNRTPWLPEELDSLDDVSLCMAWRSSFTVLEAAASVEERMAVIEHRQRCLDELQRRNPDGVAAWLSSGARASGNPLPYLRDGDGHDRSA